MCKYNKDSCGDGLGRDLRLTIVIIAFEIEVFEIEMRKQIMHSAQPQICCNGGYQCKICSAGCACKANNMDYER